MYARPGTAYVYFTYGMHFMLNISCYRAGHPAAVLVRALEPLDGLEAMRVNRAGTTAPQRPIRDTDLCSGPGKLCRALRIDRACNGLNLLRKGPLRLVTGSDPLAPIANGPRIGVDCAGPAWAARKLRWWVKGNPNVSA
jgi:DNA-3-methyladenine glycosylase